MLSITGSIVFSQLPRFLCGSLSSREAIFEDGALKEVVKVKGGHEGGSLIKDWCPYKKRCQEGACDEKRGQEDTVRRSPSTRQRERPQEKANTLIPSLQNCETTPFCR